MASAMLAALSAVLTYFFFVVAAGLALLTWRDRRRFAHWRAMGARGRADTILNLSLFGALAIAGYHRAIASYSFATHQLATGNPGTQAAAIYLPLQLMAMSGVLWWLCIELIGSKFGGRAWLGLLAAGAFIGVMVFART